MARRPGAARVPVWCLWSDGALYVVSRAGRAAGAGAGPGTTTATVHARGDHGGRIVTWAATVERVRPDSEQWSTVVPQLAGKRLNSAPADELVSRWAADACRQSPGAGASAAILDSGRLADERRDGDLAAGDRHDRAGHRRPVPPDRPPRTPCTPMWTDGASRCPGGPCTRIRRRPAAGRRRPARRRGRARPSRWPGSSGTPRPGRTPARAASRRSASQAKTQTSATPATGVGSRPRHRVRADRQVREREPAAGHAAPAGRRGRRRTGRPRPRTAPGRAPGRSTACRRSAWPARRRTSTAARPPRTPGGPCPAGMSPRRTWVTAAPTLG